MFIYKYFLNVYIGLTYIKKKLLLFAKQIEKLFKAKSFFRKKTKISAKYSRALCIFAMVTKQTQYIIVCKNLN